MWGYIFFVLFALTAGSFFFVYRRQQRAILELQRARDKIEIEEARVFDFLHGLGTALSDTSRPADPARPHRRGRAAHPRGWRRRALPRRAKRGSSAPCVRLAELPAVLPCAGKRSATAGIHLAELPAVAPGACGGRRPRRSVADEGAADDHWRRSACRADARGAAPGALRSALSADRRTGKPRRAGHGARRRGAGVRPGRVCDLPEHRRAVRLRALQCDPLLASGGEEAPRPGFADRLRNPAHPPAGLRPRDRGFPDQRHQHPRAAGQRRR